MKHHRFFINQKIEDQEVFTLSDRDILHQWKRVLRFQPGQSVILLDNTGVKFHGTVETLNADTADIRKVAYTVIGNDTDNTLSVKLYPAMIKKDKFDWVLQKSTEIGVNEFHPVISERTEKTGFKLERATKIVTEASEQSERVFLPKVSEPQILKDVVKQVIQDKSESDVVMALHMNGELLHEILKDISIKDTSNLKDNLDGLKDKMSYRTAHVFIGPEGGWTDQELELFTENNVKIVSVGSPVLRAETASVVVSTLLLL